MNAKKELLDIITAKNLTILKIEIDYDAEGLFCSYDDYEDNINHITSIDDLDFEYDSGYGLQELQGVVYCKDKNDNPVWLTRGEYDGSEWWNINTIPEFYTINK